MSPISSGIQALPIQMRHRRERPLIERGQHELFLMVEGRGEQRLADGRTWSLHSGDLACFPAGSRHIGDARPGATCRCWILLWDPATHRHVPPPLRGPVAELVTHGPWWHGVGSATAMAVQGALRHLSAPVGEEVLLAWQLRLACFQQILIHALMARSRASRPQTQEVEQALQHIADHLHEPWSVGRAAATMALSRSQFQHRCHELLGRGFTDWLIERRVQRAVELLRNGDLAMDEIVQSCGFGSRSTFFRHLRLRSGQPPGAWLGR